MLSPTVYQARLRFKADGSPLIIIDADAGLDFRDAADRLRESVFEAIIYTTASNRNGDKFRIVMPLAEPVSIETQKRLIRAVCEFLKPGWVPDTSKVNGYSLFYLPGQYPGAQNEFIRLGGDFIDPSVWLDLFSQTENKKPPAQVVHHLSSDADWSPDKCEAAISKYRGTGSDRHKALYGLMVSVAMSAINYGYDLSANELADLTWGQQQQNRPSSPYTQHALGMAAARAISDARSRVTDPAYMRKAAHAEYLASEFERGSVVRSPRWTRKQRVRISTTQRRD